MKRELTRRQWIESATIAGTLGWLGWGKPGPERYGDAVPSVLQVVGVGGTGCNVLRTMQERSDVWYGQAFQSVAMDADAESLAQTPADLRLQLGASLVMGLGCGARPEIGTLAAYESHTQIETILANAEAVILIAGLGGGCGTGGAPVIARTAQVLGVPTTVIVSLPCAHEGKKRHRQAKGGQHELREYVRTMAVVSGDELLSRHQDSWSYGDYVRELDRTLARHCVTTCRAILGGDQLEEGEEWMI